jgi:hypothetical protein
MLILWIRKNKKGGQAPAKETERKSFQEHDEEMKKFSLAHPKIENEPENTLTNEEPILAPVHWVRLNKNIQN